MIWIHDPSVCIWASRTMPDLPVQPVAQFGGRRINLAALAHAGWGQNPVPPLPPPAVSSPNNIIWCFQNKHWLAGVALVASWGTMLRPNVQRMILQAGLHQIQNTIQNSLAQIVPNATIQNVWTQLAGVNGLNWTSVMTSKTLHFMARANGIVVDAPVPLDNGIIRRRLWPDFVWRVNQLRAIGHGHGPHFRQHLLPDRDFAAYNSYMTAVLTWASWQSARTGANWTTTNVENTLFHMLQNLPPSVHLPWI